MDEAAWKAVCNYYNRVFKKIDPGAKAGRWSYQPAIVMLRSGQ